MRDTWNNPWKTFIKHKLKTRPIKYDKWLLNCFWFLEHKRYPVDSMMDFSKPNVYLLWEVMCVKCDIFILENQSNTDFNYNIFRPSILTRNVTVKQIISNLTFYIDWFYSAQYNYWYFYYIYFILFVTSSEEKKVHSNVKHKNCIKFLAQWGTTYSFKRVVNLLYLQSLDWWLH